MAIQLNSISRADEKVELKTILFVIRKYFAFSTRKKLV